MELSYVNFVIFFINKFKELKARQKISAEMELINGNYAKGNSSA